VLHFRLKQDLGGENRKENLSFIEQSAGENVVKKLIL